MADTLLTLAATWTLLFLLAFLLGVMGSLLIHCTSLRWSVGIALALLLLAEVNISVKEDDKKTCAPNPQPTMYLNLK